MDYSGISYGLLVGFLLSIVIEHYKNSRFTRWIKGVCYLGLSALLLLQSSSILGPNTTLDNNVSKYLIVIALIEAFDLLSEYYLKGEKVEMKIDPLSLSYNLFISFFYHFLHVFFICPIVLVIVKLL